ncbi:MAG: hypothetical protein ACYDA5_11115 [Vulcanimicrobiaceae bacterium]
MPRYDSIARLVAESPDEALFTTWPLWELRPLGPAKALEQMTLEVDDASADSTLGVILLLARLAACDLTSFPKAWIEAAASWEKTGMVEDPWTSWAALVSALAHKHFPLGRPLSNEDYAAAWRDTVHFTGECLARNAHPLQIPPMGDCELWREATASLKQEEQSYHNWLLHAEVLQLSLPLTNGGGRRLMIDALLTVEDQATGAAKVFYRNDRSNTSLGCGFTLAAQYRPTERSGDGNDFTISLDYRAGVNLLDLWHELEQRECAAWAAADETRPAANPRVLDGIENRYDEPWYIDRERTLIGAPRRLPDGRAGSKLVWSDIREAIWTCYNPLNGIEVLGATNGSSEVTPAIRLVNLEPTVLEPPVSEYGKRLLLARWAHDRNGGLQNAPRGLNVSATVERTIATLIRVPEPHATGATGVLLGSLVPPGSWRRVALSGGFAIVTEHGLFILDDWHPEVRLDFKQLEDEFKLASHLDHQLKKLEKRIKKWHVQEKRAWWQRRQQEVVREVAWIMFELADLRGSAAGTSSHADVRSLREAMDLQWALDRRLAAMEQQVQTIAGSLKALGDASMSRLTHYVTIGGFTFALAFYLAGPIGVLLAFWFTKGQVPLTNAQPPVLYWWSAFFIIGTAAFFGVRSLIWNDTPSPPKTED